MLLKAIVQMRDDGYRSGLDTDGLDPSVWCARVVEYVCYEVRLDRVWVRWGKYMKATCHQLFFSGSCGSTEREQLRRSKQKSELEADYRRLCVQVRFIFIFRSYIDRFKIRDPPQKRENDFYPHPIIKSWRTLSAQ